MEKWSEKTCLRLPVVSLKSALCFAFFVRRGIDLDILPDTASVLLGFMETL
jgi:hypothetical protein